MILRLSAARPEAIRRRRRRFEPVFRIRHLDDPILDGAGEAHAARRLRLHYVEEVRHQALHVELDRAVHVEDVLGGEVAGVVGEAGLLAEALEQLNVGEAVGEAGRVAQGDFGPGDLVGAVEGEEGGEADSVGEV
jgi:hypothetical protein